MLAYQDYISELEGKELGSSNNFHIYLRPKNLDIKASSIFTPCIASELPIKIGATVPEFSRNRHMNLKNI